MSHDSGDLFTVDALLGHRGLRLLLEYFGAPKSSQNSELSVRCSKRIGQMNKEAGIDWAVITLLRSRNEVDAITDSERNEPN